MPPMSNAVEMLPAFAASTGTATTDNYNVSCETSSKEQVIVDYTGPGRTWGNGQKSQVDLII